MNGATTSPRQRRRGQPPPAAAAAVSGPQTFAGKLDRLFRMAGDPSLEMVAGEIRRRGGPTISASYLWLLRQGKKENPTLSHLTALADYFGVPPVYFFDDALTDRAGGDIEGQAALRDPDVRTLALLAAGLSPLARQALVTLAEQLGRFAAAPASRARKGAANPTASPAAPSSSPSPDTTPAAPVSLTVRRPRR
jgi:transcriptional regulator with XRE-family HTH domain